MNTRSFLLVGAGCLALLAACGGDGDDTDSSGHPAGQAGQGGQQERDCSNHSHCLQFELAKPCEGGNAAVHVTNTCDYELWCRLGSYTASHDGGRSSSRWGPQEFYPNQTFTGWDYNAACHDQLGIFMYWGYCVPGTRPDGCDIPGDEELPPIIPEHLTCGQPQLEVTPNEQGGSCGLQLPSCKGTDAGAQDLRIECVPQLEQCRELAERQCWFTHRCQCFSGDTLLDTFDAGLVQTIYDPLPETIEEADPVCDAENPENVLRALLAGHCGRLTYYYTDFDEIAY